MMSATSSGGVSSIVSLIVSTICWTEPSIASRICSAATSTRARQTRQQVAASQRYALIVVVARIGRADGDLDVLCGALAQEQVVLASGVGNDVLVELVAADAQAATDDNSAEADDGDLSRPATDVDDQAAGRLTDRQAGADRGGHGLLDESRPACAGVEGRVTDGALLDLSHARRDADEHARARDQAHAVVHLVHEVLDHLLGHVEVADDSVAQRPDSDDVGRRAAEHALCLGADRQNPLGGVDGYDARLADDDAAVADVDERVGGAEIDADIAREHAEEGVEHALDRSFVRAAGTPGRMTSCRTAGPPCRESSGRAALFQPASGRVGAGKARAVYPPRRRNPADATRARTERRSSARTRSVGAGRGSTLGRGRRARPPRRG